MGAENQKTFIRYYQRFNKYISEWLVHLVTMISSYDQSATYKKLPLQNYTIQIKWQYFTELASRLNQQIARYSDLKIQSQHQYTRYLFAVFCRKGCGLGP